MRVALSRSAEFRRFERKSLPALLGTAVHRVFERLPPRGISMDDAKAHLEREWEAVVGELAVSLEGADYLVPPPAPERWPHYQKARLRALRGALAVVERRGTATSQPEGRSSAVQVEKAVSGAEGRLVGRVDRVEQGVGAARIVDLKSGFDGAEELPERYREQLLLYAFMWHEETGEWPTECAIEGPTGARVAFEPDAHEATDVAAEALALLDAYNRRAGQSAADLATPSEEACRWCDFRVCCPAFFAAVDEGWATYGRRFVLGTVVPDPTGGSRVLAMKVVQGNLSDDVEVARVLLPADMELEVAGGQTVALAGGLRASADGDVGVDWRTHVSAWG